MIQGNMSQMTLTQLIANGAQVKEGDLIATFDPTQQIGRRPRCQGQVRGPGPPGGSENCRKSRERGKARCRHPRQAEARPARSRTGAQQARRPRRHRQVQEDEARAAGAQVHAGEPQEIQRPHERVRDRGSAHSRIAARPAEDLHGARRRTTSRSSKFTRRWPVWWRRSSPIAPAPGTCAGGRPTLPQLSACQHFRSRPRCRYAVPSTNRTSPSVPGTPAPVSWTPIPNSPSPPTSNSPARWRPEDWERPIKTFIAVFRIDKSRRAPDCRISRPRWCSLCRACGAARGRPVSPRWRAVRRWTVRGARAGGARRRRLRRLPLPQGSGALLRTPTLRCAKANSWSWCAAAAHCVPTTPLGIYTPVGSQPPNRLDRPGRPVREGRRPDPEVRFLARPNSS